jgi:peptide deformylase
MVQPVVHDPLFLAVKSDPAGAEDLETAADLADTLRFHSEHCLGMAANMIGRNVAVIAVQCPGMPLPLVMLNPEIMEREGQRVMMEGCLSLDGQRPALRAEKITVRYQTMNLDWKQGEYRGLAGQAIQHEVDHLRGILI